MSSQIKDLCECFAYERFVKFEEDEREAVMFVLTSRLADFFNRLANRPKKFNFGLSNKLRQVASVLGEVNEYIKYKSVPEEFGDE